MRKLTEKWRQFWRKVLMSLGISGTALVISAGYSMMEPDMLMGTVKSSATDNPVPNITVTIRQGNSNGETDVLHEHAIVTNSNGIFTYRLPQFYGDMIYIIEFEDETENDERFQHKRVIHSMKDGKSIEITLDNQ